MEGKKFGLVLPKKTNALLVKGSSVFDSNSDDETAGNSARPRIPQSKVKMNLDKSSGEDPSIYEYDNIYDEMKEQEIKERASKEKQNSRYITTLMKAADKRKKEYERRVDKKIQIEREKEGDKFKDKDSFVTSSYKKKIQEMEEEEERERRENAINDMMDVTKQKDLSGFYRHFLKQTVGEEKIPVYGDKSSIKKEVLSEPENETFHTKKTDSNKDLIERKPNKMKSHVNCDSDSVSSDFLSDEAYDKTDQGEKQSTSSQNVQNYKAFGLDNENSCQEDDSAIHSYLKHHPKTNDFEVSNKSSKKREIDDIDESSNESISKESEIQLAKPATKNSVLGDKNVNIHIKNGPEVKPKSQQNIYLKRNVGAVFEEAQARYFKRIAEGNLS